MLPNSAQRSLACPTGTPHPRPFWLSVVVCAMVIGFAVAPREVVAQQVAAQPASDAPAAEEPQPAETPKALANPTPNQSGWPDTTIWIDDNGTPRPLINITYEEFSKAWRAYRGLDDTERSPRYTLHSLRADGVLEPTSAATELNVSLEVQLHDAERVAVPLRFDNTIFAGELEGLDPQSEHLAYDAKRGGYLLWLNGDVASTKRTLRLTLLAPVTGTADGARLSLNVPRANDSRITLTTTKRVVAPSVSDGAILDTESTPDGGTRLLIAGAVGPTVVAFRSPSAEQVNPRALLRSQASMHVRIDDSSIRTTANLTVDGLGQAFDRFRVRLPPGATPLLDLQDRSEGVRVEEVADDVSEPIAETGETAKRLLVEVSRAKRSAKPVTIKIVTQASIDAPLVKANSSNAGELVDLSGFEVIDAPFQSGAVAITVKEGVQLDLVDSVSATRIEPRQLPEELAGLTPDLAVRYDRPAWRLPVRISVPEPRVEATPNYRLEIMPETMKLTVDTDFRVFGAGVFEFVYDLNEWENPITDPTAGLVDAEQMRLRGDRWIVPLNRAAGRRAEVTLEFERSLDDDQPIDVRLPIPANTDTVRAGTLTVVVHPSVELSVDRQQLAELAPIAVAPDAGSPTDPAALRTRKYRITASQADKARFVARRTRRPGRLEAQSQSVVSVDDNQVTIDQTLSFNALFQPVDQILLWAPAGLIFDDGFELTSEPAFDDQTDSTVDTVPLVAERIDPEDFEAAEVPSSLLTEPGTAWRVSLPGPRRSKFVLRAIGRATQNTLGKEAIAAPLLKPLATAADGWESVVTSVAPVGRRVRLAKGVSGWKVLPANDTTEPSSTLRLVAGSDADPLRLVTALVPATRAQAAVVRNAWFQTWTTAQRRQTRAAYRVAGTSDQIEVELPEGVAAKDVEFRLDGSLVTPRLLDEGRVALLNERLGDGDEHTITTRHLVDAAGDNLTRLAPPRLVADTTLTDCYWEVVQAASQHALTTPDGFAGAHRWGWGAAGWGRIPQRSSEQLAEWVGAPPGLVPSAGEYRYLFMSVGIPSGEPVVRLVRRTTAVLAVSAAVVLVGLIVSQLNLLRYKATFYTLLFLAMLCLLLAPEPALLVVQAGAIGLVLTAATVLADSYIRGRKSAGKIVLSSQTTSLGRQAPATLEQESTVNPTITVPPIDTAQEA